jgi:molybdate-binding protein
MDSPVKRKLEPSRAQKLAGFMRSMGMFVKSGCKISNDDEQKRRIAICDKCNRRRGATCGLCGCFIAIKVKGEVFECPEGKWKTPQPVLAIQ